MPSDIDLAGRQRTLKAPYLLGFRHKKGRPWTPLDVYLVGRGNLKRLSILLILNENYWLEFYMEYILEYQV